MDGLLLAAALIAWGAQAVVPWRLRRENEEGRRRWGYAALPLLLAGTLAALLYVRFRPDAALAAGLASWRSSIPLRLVVLFLAAILAADLVLAFGRSRLENRGWPVAAGFGLAFLAAAAFAGELLRAGEGPSGPPQLLFAAAGCRLLVALAAGEVVAPGRPLLAAAAGILLPVYFLLLPPDLRRLLVAGGHWLTLAAAALLLLLARFLPPALRRPGLAAAILLAGLFLSSAGDFSQALGDRPLPPLPTLSKP